MSNISKGTVENPVAEAALKGSGGDDKERVEEDVVDLRTCRPKSNG